MRRLWLILTAFLLAANAAGAYWLFDSWRAAGSEPVSITAPEKKAASEAAALPDLPQSELRPEDVYAMVYEKTIFRKERRFPEPEAVDAGSQIAAALPNIGLRGIVMASPNEVPKVYFEVEEAVQKQVGPRTVSAKNREVKAFFIGDEVSSGWRLTVVRETEVELQGAGVTKLIALGKPSEFDNLPQPMLQVPTPGQIPTPAGSVIILSPETRAPEQPQRGEGRGASPADVRPPRTSERSQGETAIVDSEGDALQGPIVMTGSVSATASPQTESQPRKDSELTLQQKQEALERLKQLRDEAEKRREEGLKQ